MNDKQHTGSLALRCGVLLLSAVALWQPETAAALPGQFTARYSISAQGFEIARSEWRMEPAGAGVFIYTTRSESVGVAKMLRNEEVLESSRFRIADGDVQPLRYSYRRTRGKRKREADVSFDWEGGTGINTINGATWDMPLTRGLQDKISYVLAVMLAMEKRGVPPATIALSDGGKLKSYNLKLAGREQRATSLGSVDTVHIVRTTEDDPRVTHIWMAPSLGFLPVHIEHHEDGDIATLSLESVEGLGSQ